MAFLTFRGGIHPNDGKDLSKNCPVEKYLPKGDLAILVSQHIGAPAKPIVKKGDHVLAGQKIAEAGGFVSAPIHSSVSGTVKGIEKRLTAVGAMGDAIIIENDGLYESVEYTPAALSDLSREDILKRIQEGGVVGQGGAGFPTHVKLSPKEPDKIDYILVNGAECEPYITSDYRRMMEEPESIVGGLEVILKAFPKAVGCICIEDNKPDCIARMKEAIKGKERMEVKELKTKYPQGGERTLIYAVTGREINSTMLPADVGCVVDNVETVTSVYKAVILGQPVISRNVTVTGDGIRTPKNFSVLTGTDLSELVDAAGGLKEKIAKAISGGPMMGFALYDLHIPCTKTTSSLLFLERDAVSEAKQIQTACINCGRCVSVCPGHVVPARLATLAEHGDMAGFEKMDGMECCECGCCSYICPAKRPLTQSMQQIAHLRREYTKGGLRRRDLPAEPLTLFERWLSQACDAKLADPTAMVVATVDEHGQPYQRIVLLKHYDEKGMVFYTNLGSRKAHQIENNPRVSLLFPWHTLERQVMVIGKAERLSTLEVMKYFHSRPRDSQIGAWVSKQSSRISARGILESKFLELKQKFQQGEVPLPSFWGGFRVSLEQIEFWQGGEHRLHDRFLYQRENDAWKIDRLAP